VDSAPYNGSIEVLIFGGIGVGMLFLVLASWRLIVRAVQEESVAVIVGHIMGLIAAGSWFLVAAEAFRMYTSVGATIPDITGRSTLQATIVHGTYLDLTGALLLFLVAFTGWAVMLATAGRRRGVISVPVSVVLGMGVMVLAIPLVIPFSVPWPLFGYMLSVLVLGISFLIRSRR
jgi:hypothetical protein